KSLLVITLFVVACSFASAQTFGFYSVGSGQYCNYEQLVAAGGNLYGGQDNLSVCGVSIGSSISGFGAKLDTTSSDGYTVSGAGVIYGDSIYAQLDGDPYAQWTVWTSLKASKEKNGYFHGKLGWIGAATFSGFFAGTNQGYIGAPPTREGGVSKGPASLSKAQFKK
ncbi:MAG: hypothetical protein WBP91_12495, partial [Terriglobales bacterium]